LRQPDPRKPRFVAGGFSGTRTLPTLLPSHRPVCRHREIAMSEHTLSAVLTFALLAGGAAAIGSEMFSPRQAAVPQATLAVVTLPTVTITGQRHKRIKVAAGTPDEPDRPDENGSPTCATPAPVHI
jgi:hypothetical protein